MREIYTVQSEKKTYVVVREDSDVYRKEGTEIARWRLFGGANPDEYEHFEDQLTGAGCDGPEFTYYEGKEGGPLAGRRFDSVADIARLRPVPIIGDQLIVTPLDSPIAREKKWGTGKAGNLSGRITQVRLPTDTESEISDILNAA